MSRSISPSRTTIHLPPLPKPECLTANDTRASNYGPTILKRPTRLPRPRYRTCVEKPRGVQDFFNIMWDPHVYHGQAFKTIDQDREERCKSIQNNLNSKASTRKVIKLPQRKLGGICPWPLEVPETHQRSLASQCERFLIDSIEEIKLLDKTIQTPRYVVPSDECAKKPKEKNSCGIDVSTQIEVCDLFDLIELIESIAETLAEKISEQSILETMEEEEISALMKFENAMKQRELDDRRNVSQLAERVQLEKFEENEIAEEKITDAKEERILQGLVEQTCFARSAMEMVKARLCASLKKRGYFIDSAQLNIERRFIPWLNHMVDCELEHTTIPTAIIDDILVEATSQRLQAILDPLKLTLDMEYLRNSKNNSLEYETTLYTTDAEEESDFDEDMKRIMSSNYNAAYY